jgi:hypothetical protein
LVIYDKFQIKTDNINFNNQVNIAHGYVI